MKGAEINWSTALPPYSPAMDADGANTSTQAAWEQRRRSAEFRAQTGSFAAVGVLLALVGVGLGLGKAFQGARHAPVLDGLLWVVGFLVLGVLVLFAGRILDAIHLHDDRR